MNDLGHKETDKLLEELERKINREYRQAVIETQQKLTEYFANFKRKDQIWQEWVKDGKKTEKEWKEWRTGQMMVGDRWKEMRDTLAEDYHNANQIARSMVNGYMPDVYALNHNYSTFLVEKGAKVDTSYTLYDRQTVERLIRDEPELLQPPGASMKKKLAFRKDLAWQKGQIQSVTLQSILQGESVGKMANRIAETMGEFNHAASIRYARTATTSAENAGRLDGYKRADKMGIKMKQTWIATLDGRTRHEHRQLDGQTVGIDEPFKVDGYEIRFPGDPQAEPFLIWNCRCTTIAQIDGFERDPADMGLRYDEKLGTMSYEEWKNKHKKPEPIPETQPEPPKPQYAFNLNSPKMKASMGDDDYDAYKALVDSSPVGGFYEQYAEQGTYVRGNGGWYQGRKVNYSYDTSHPGRHKYSTLAHENGHFFDDMYRPTTLEHKEIDALNDAARKSGYFGTLIKQTPSQSDSFLAALRADMDALKSKVTDMSIRTEFLATTNLRNATNGIQDALDGFFGTQKKGILPWGHGDTYYNRAYNKRIKYWGAEKAIQEAYKDMGFDVSNQTKVKMLTRQYEAASETWANVCSAVTCGGEELDAIKKYMPKTLEAFMKIIGGGKTT